MLRVLGSDLVVNLALGLAAGRAFSIPRQGALGLAAFWQHATYTAWLVQNLVRHMPADTRPSPGVAYLSALVHNIGFLILGQLFRPEYEMLNRLIAINPRTRISDVERQVLALGEARRVVALGHDRLGARVLKSWDLPAATIAAAAHHHDPGYDGPHSNIVLPILVADRLTRRIALGDGDSGHVPDSVLASLGLSNEDVERVYLRLVDAREGLDDLALQLAA